MKPGITGIILAGGKSTRMGENKALIQLNGIPLIQHVFNHVSAVAENILISSNTNLPGFSASIVVNDKFKDIGPVGGIYSCLEASNTELNIITTCDTPLLTREFYQYLIDTAKSFEISNPIHDGITEPIMGVFRKSVLPVIKDYIDKKIYAPPKIIQSVKSQCVEINSSMAFYHPLMFESINSPEILKKVETRLNS